MCKLADKIIIPKTRSRITPNIFISVGLPLINLNPYFAELLSSLRIIHSERIVLTTSFYFGICQIRS